MNTLNPENIRLDFPSLAVFPSYVEALREGYYRGSDSVTPEEKIKTYENNPKAHILSENEDKTGQFFTAPTGETFPCVPYEKLWLTCEDVFIGSVSLRLELNEFCRNVAGHVGYGIRPHYQGQGYGTLALRLTRVRAKQNGMEKLLLTCSPDNTASEKIIVKNGGVYKDTLPDPYGYGLTIRYWVPTAIE